MANGDARFWAKQFENGSGVPFDGVKVYHYAAGTTTDKTVWTDAGKVGAAEQPVVGDSRGMVSFYADGDYKLVVKDKNEVTLYTWDNVRITSDTATMWEGDYGTAYPAASAANKGQLFAKVDGLNLIQEMGINDDGTGFKPIPMAQDIVWIDQYANFNAAITAIGASVKTLMINKSKAVTANVTVPATLSLEFIGAGELSISTGVTLTINGPVAALPNKQIFSGSGSVAFGQGNADIFMEWFGLKTSNTAAQNDTAISNAIASMPSTGGGTLRVFGWNYKISASITIKKHMIRLIGPHDAADYSDDLATPDPVFVWDGAASGVMMKLAPVGTAAGIVGGYIRGISLDGGAVNGQANIVGMELGDVTGSTFDGSAWQRVNMDGVSMIRVFKGMRIGRADVFNFNRLIIRNNNPITANSIGIEATPTATGPIISGHFTHGAISGFARLVQIGNITSGTPSGIYFDHMTMENYSVYGFDIRRCDHFVISNCNFEGGAVPIQPILKVGDDALAISAKSLIFAHNRCVLGADSAGSIRLERFEGLTIGPGNQFNGANTATSYVFWNNSGATSRVGGQFFGNIMDSTVQALFDPAHGNTGFVFIQENHPDRGTANPYREIANHRRLAAELGPALVAADLALSAGWGTTASISSISAKDCRGRFTVASAGTGQAANPTITLTFKDLAWLTAPYALVNRNGGSQPSVLPTWSTSTTTLVITFPGTPVAGESYNFEYFVMG